MTLAELIRGKGKTERVATLTVATDATDNRELHQLSQLSQVSLSQSSKYVPQSSVNSVGTVATVTVANPWLRHAANDEDTAIRNWLAHIGESDEVMIAECLQQCATDNDARAYYLRRASELPQQDMDDDRITCPQCVSFINERCYKPSEGRPWRPPHLPRRCARFKPRAGNLDQRTGRERWPSL